MSTRRRKGKEEEENEEDEEGASLLSGSRSVKMAAKKELMMALRAQFKVSNINYRKFLKRG